jgi:hypothetical protein
MTHDRFWETFWLTFFGVFIISMAVSGWLFFSHINNLNAAAVGISFDATKDPFESGLTSRLSAVIADGYVYRNALPLGTAHWNWDSTTAWTTTERAFEGGASMRVNFTKPWGGVGINGFSVPRASYQGISLAVYPDASVGDLYLELYDSKGQSLGRQSLGWYTSSGVLVPNTWQQVFIPLENLLQNSDTKSVTGVALSTKNSGIAYVDAVKFEKSVVAHAPWVAPKDGGPPYNPFATSSPVVLPYKATFTPSDFSKWYAYYGLFRIGDSVFEIGPKPNETNDTVAVISGGRSWSDYRVSVILDWGLTSVFSILARVTGPSSFVSCAFSYYGQTVQIYNVQNGVSTQLAQSPSLGIRYYTPWENVSVGASVQGNKVICYVNGERELSADIPAISPTGSVGFEAWDTNTYASPHAIKSIEIKQLIGE